MFPINKHFQPNIDINYIISELESNDNFILSKLLREMGEVSVTKLFDSNGMTLLHHAVLKGVEGKT